VFSQLWIVCQCVIGSWVNASLVSGSMSRRSWVMVSGSVVCGHESWVSGSTGYASWSVIQWVSGSWIFVSGPCCSMIYCGPAIQWVAIVWWVRWVTEQWALTRDPLINLITWLVKFRTCRTVLLSSSVSFVLLLSFVCIMTTCIDVHAVCVWST